jgi:hypothetical protein
MIMAVAGSFRGQMGDRHSVFPPGGEGGTMMQGGLAPFTLQSNVLKLPLFSLKPVHLCLNEKGEKLGII